MLEVRYRTARALPLGRVVSLAAPVNGVRVQPAGEETRFSLRLRNPAGTVAGLPLDRPINTLAGDDRRWIARLGPDEWLIGAAEADSDLLASALAADLAGQVHSLVDVSQRNVGIDVEGEDAAIALNAGVPLDLSEAAFPAGRATRTLLGKAEIVLIRHAGSTPRYRVECWRSFSTYVHGFLKEAAYGLGPVAARATQ